MENSLARFQKYLGPWREVRFLGGGAYGKVYEIERVDFGRTFKAALKVITFDSGKTDVNALMAEGMSHGDALRETEKAVKQITEEYALMAGLKGNTNIVSYEDHQAIRREDGTGWDILIRMELLTPLWDYVRANGNEISEADIIKLGIDMCKALELCHSQDIIHRDIKPENILISPNGAFKLGDFGVARRLEKTSHFHTRRGTPPYMAPEVFYEKSYDMRADVYSLGLVLYALLNGNRTPFLPLPPITLTREDRDRAFIKRVKGESLPNPATGDADLVSVVMNACAYNPDDRYATARHFRKALEDLRTERTISSDTAATMTTMTTLPVKGSKSAHRARSRKVLYLAASLCAALIISSIAFLSASNGVNLPDTPSETIGAYEPPTTSVLVVESSEESVAEYVPSETEATGVSNAEVREMALWLSGSKALDNVVKASDGVGYTMALTSDGSLYAIGDNSSGQLGDGTTMPHTEPVFVMSSVTNVVTGSFHTAIIKADGSLWAWGENKYGELGDGTREQHLEPVKIMENVASISAGYYFTLAVKTDGSLWAWGDSSRGQLGNGEEEYSLIPIKVMSDVVSVSAGYSYVCAIKTDGTLWTWGDNARGQLGDGTRAERREPVCVLDDVTNVTASYDYTQAVKTDGSLWAWGANDRGQLGDGTKDDRWTPVLIMDGLNTSEPSAAPTATPTDVSTDMPISVQTHRPQTTSAPKLEPTPTVAPTPKPTIAPTARPTLEPIETQEFTPPPIYVDFD